MSALTRTAVAGMALAVLVLSGCSSEIRGIEDTADAPAAASPAPTVPSDPGANVDAPDNPTPVTFALDECMSVDFSGVGVLFVGVVACDEPHQAEAYHSLEVEAEQTAADIAAVCEEELPSRYRDPSMGEFYALESPVNYIYNQGLATTGDEVFCVFVHAEERSSAM